MFISMQVRSVKETAASALKYKGGMALCRASLVGSLQAQRFGLIVTATEKRGTNTNWVER
jgi:hypothetical protein